MSAIPGYVLFPEGFGSKLLGWGAYGALCVLANRYAERSLVAMWCFLSLAFVSVVLIPLYTFPVSVGWQELVEWGPGLLIVALGPLQRGWWVLGLTIVAFRKQIFAGWITSSQASRT